MIQEKVLWCEKYGKLYCSGSWWI